MGFLLDRAWHAARFVEDDHDEYDSGWPPEAAPARSTVAHVAVGIHPMRPLLVVERRAESCASLWSHANDNDQAVGSYFQRCHRILSQHRQLLGEQEDFSFDDDSQRERQASAYSAFAKLSKPEISANLYLQIVFAVQLFDLTITPMNGVGILLTLFGGAWYAYIGMTEKSKTAERQPGLVPLMQVATDKR